MTNGEKLNVLDIVKKSYLSLWIYKAEILKMSWVWLVLAGLFLGFHSWLFPNLNIFTLSFYNGLVVIAAAGAMAPAWHQTLIDPNFTLSWKNIGIHSNVLPYLWPMVTLLLLTLFPDAMTFLDQEDGFAYGDESSRKTTLLIKSLFIIVALLLYMLTFFKRPSRMPAFIVGLLLLFYVTSFLFTFLQHVPSLSAIDSTKSESVFQTFVTTFYEYLITVTSYVWAIILFSLVGLILPARALGKRQFSFFDALALGKGNRFRLILILVLVDAGYFGAFYLDPLEVIMDYSVILYVILIDLLFLLVALISLSALSYSYQALVAE